MVQTNRNGVAPEKGRSGKTKARREAKARAKWEREAERRVRLCYAVERGGWEHDLLLPEIRVLQAIAVSEETWTPAAELARVGLNGTTLAGLVAVGWVEQFPTEEGEMLTFSPWSAEVLGIEPQERWQVSSGVAEQEDSSGERTRITVREPHEIPRWAVRPLPPEPGMPRPKQVPLKLPFLFRLSKLPEDVIQGLIARTIVDPVDEAIANEEWLTEQARLEDGRLDVDPESGAVREVPVVLFGSKIPREKVRRKKGKKKTRRRRRSA